MPPSDALQQYAMNLLDEAQAKRQLLQASQPVVHGRNVVDDLRHVSGIPLSFGVNLKLEDILQSALCAFELGT